jgi:hypothetical protein
MTLKGNRLCLIHIYFLILLFSSFAKGQEKAFIFGTVSDSLNKPLQGVNVSIVGEPGGISTNVEGVYLLEVVSGHQITIGFSFIGFKTEKEAITLKPGEKREINKTLKTSSTELRGVIIEDEQNRRSDEAHGSKNSHNITERIRKF